jgi:hypothetical protein
MRPNLGDLVVFYDRKLGSWGHTGRVLERRGSTLRLDVAGQDRVRLVHVDDVDGWWPKGARDRSPRAMRPVEVGP